VDQSLLKREAMSLDDKFWAYLTVVVSSPSRVNQCEKTA